MAAGAQRTPVALTIAGSDSGGGAGIQADLKAFARCGVHGASAITAVTAQSTVEVRAVQPLPPEMVLEQVRTVVADMAVAAVKVGMLGTAEVTRAVARALSELPAGVPVVVDPVMVSETGAELLDAAAREALVAEILPRTSVLTPNLHEARALTGAAPLRREQQGEAVALVRELLALGPAAVVLTGGHRSAAGAGGDAVDLFLDRGRSEPVALEGPRHADGSAHGSGCTHSSVLAAQLALGRDPLDAARVARALAGEAVGRGLRDVGHGPGPVDVIDLPRMRRA